MTDYGMPDGSLLPSNIEIRKATSADCKALADCFYTSFYPSHPFWTHEWKPEIFYDWWLEMFRLGIEDDKSMHTFCAVDTSKDNKIVAFTRWREPQADLNLDELWPDIPKTADMEVLGPFFEGMHKNRQELMKKPFWFVLLLGTDKDYQRLGIGEALVKWGCDLADKEDMEVYIDASEKGGPFYRKHFAAVARAGIPMPEKPSTYGVFNYVTYVVPPKTERSASKAAA